MGNSEHAQIAHYWRRIQELEAEVARLREALEDAQAQLTYLDAKGPKRGTTAATLARISAALATPAPAAEDREPYDAGFAIRRGTDMIQAERDTLRQTVAGMSKGAMERAREIDNLQAGLRTAEAERDELRAKLRATEAAVRLANRETGALVDVAARHTAERDAALAERDALREVLEWANRRGGLGLDVHERFTAALATPAQEDGDV